MTSGDDGVRTGRDGNVLTITLARPGARNAVDGAMLAGLEQALAAATADAAIAIVVLRADGGFFSAGGDLKERRRLIAAGSREALAARNRREGELLRRIERLPRLVVAVVEGGAIGLGLGLVAAADLVLAARPAIFAAPEVTLGAMPAQIAPLVVRRIGLAQARRLLLTGETVAADEALRLGIVHALLADRAALDEAVAARLAALRRNSPAAVLAMKRLLRSAAADPPGYVASAAAAYADLVLGTSAAGRPPT